MQFTLTIEEVTANTGTAAIAAILERCAKQLTEDPNPLEASEQGEVYVRRNPLVGKWEVRDAPAPNDKGICSVCRRPQPDGYHQHPCE